MISYCFTEQADKEFRKFPIKVQKQIIKKIKHYCSTEDPLHFADSIESQRGKVYRFRSGDYRVIFDWEGDNILVTQVVKRSEAY